MDQFLGSSCYHPDHMWSFLSSVPLQNDDKYLVLCTKLTHAILFLLTVDFYKVVLACPDCPVLGYHVPGCHVPGCHVPGCHVPGCHVLSCLFLGCPVTAVLSVLAKAVRAVLTQLFWLCWLSCRKSRVSAFLQQLLSNQGSTYILEHTPPPPPVGYKLVLFWEKLWKGEKKKGGKCKRKGKKGERKRKNREKRKWEVKGQNKWKIGKNQVKRAQ